MQFCVCERERERERVKRSPHLRYMIFFFSLLLPENLLMTVSISALSVTMKELKAQIREAYADTSPDIVQ